MSFFHSPYGPLVDHDVEPIGGGLFAVEDHRNHPALVFCYYDIRRLADVCAAPGLTAFWYTRLRPAYLQLVLAAYKRGLIWRSRDGGFDRLYSIWLTLSLNPFVWRQRRRACTDSGFVSAQEARRRGYLDKFVRSGIADAPWYRRTAIALAMAGQHRFAKMQLRLAALAELEQV